MEDKNTIISTMTLSHTPLGRHFAFILLIHWTGHQPVMSHINFRYSLQLCSKVLARLIFTLSLQVYAKVFCCARIHEREFWLLDKQLVTSSTYQKIHDYKVYSTDLNNIKMTSSPSDVVDVK
jgi:hypothetical protein